MSVEHDKAAKIIVADDDSLVCNAVVQILEMFGYQAVGVPGGMELLDKVDDTFDVVLLDINMPGMDGWEVCRKIRETDTGLVVLAQAPGQREERPMSLQPLPVDPPISGPFWTLMVPALLFAVAFLATPYGRRLTGQTLYVDGGIKIMA